MAKVVIKLFEGEPAIDIEAYKDKTRRRQSKMSSDKKIDL
jgi:hypothetical protein